MEPNRPPFLFSCSALILALLFYYSDGSETIFLHPANFSKIKIKFDFGDGETSFFTKMPPQPEARSAMPRKDKPFDSTVITALIRDKLSRLKDYLSTTDANANGGNRNETVRELVLFDSFVIPVHGPEYKLNVSVDTVQISGITTGYTVSDIATNHKSRKISALLRIPGVRVTMFYKVNGLLLRRQNQTEPYADKGRITYAVHGWRTVFAGKIIHFDNHTGQMEISGFGMRSHYNYFDSGLDSFLHGPQSDRTAIDVAKLISSSVMKKVINELDDRFETIMLDHLGIRETGTWIGNSRKQPDTTADDYPEREEDGQLLMMESRGQRVTNGRRNRNKRQVPCEPGEELDEYVDSLFRFLKRLIRVMEPFNLPNATIELEEYNLQIFLHNGRATQAYTFERKKPAWVLCMNDTTSLGLTVGIEDARINYQYRVIQDWRLLFDGDLEAQLRRPKAQLQITQLAPPENEDEEVDFDSDSDAAEDEEEPMVQQRIDKLKVWKPGQIVVLIRGLGNFSQTLSMLINQMLTDTSMLDPILRMIETDGVVAANEMLRNVSIPIFSII